VVITDTQGKIEYVNPKFSQVTGYTLKEIKGKNPQFLKSGFMSRKLYKQLWETICAGEEWQGEFYNKKKNGELFWELASISPIKNEKGIVTHFVAVKEDITRRKKTELELQKEIMFNQFLKDIAIASNEALNLEDAVQVCLDRVCELSGWPVGHLYVVNEDTGELNPTKVWHIDDPIRFATFKKVTEATHFSSGIGLPGRVLSSGKPAWIVDVNKDPNFPRAQLAKDLGVKTGFGFPILTGKNVVAVLEFFSSQVTGHDEDLLDVMGNIGTQLGRVSERKRGEKKLRQSHQELRDLFHRLQTIREEERTFIAREIHDELGQLLTVLKIDTSWIEKKLPKEEKILLNKTRAMITFIDKIIESVKRISSDLRPEELDMLGLTEAIEWQAQEFEERMGIKCDLDLSLCDVSLEPDRSTTIFRILQETLTNVARHANASKVKIKFCEENGDVVLEVKDNGKGISKRKISDPKSLGLLGMKERVRLWEGNIKINGKQGQGTTVTVKIPMN
ncbi:MAG: PAS domain S-box protein, partial [Nitrospinales bacterium]